MTDERLNVDAALAMVAGQDMNKFYNAQVSEDDKQMLRYALENIFQGSSVALWIAGGTLGNAWNKALDNMRDEFFTTSRRDIVTVFLQHAVFEHRSKWTDKIRTNDNRAQTFNMMGLNKFDTERMLRQAETQKQNGYDIIKQVFLKYDGGFRPAPKSPQTNEQIITRERVNTRDERVRERTK